MPKQMLRLEFSLSPGGVLRAWFKLNLIFAIVLAIPTVFVVPVMTVLLLGAVSWSFLIYQVMRNLVFALVWGIILVGIVGTVVFAVGQTRSRDD